MWVIFEGLDKAGKTTLEWEFLKATNFKHVVIDRGPVGYMTFDKILGRETKLGNQEFIHQARKIMKKKNKDFMVVYCFASEDVAIKRLNEHNEECPYDYGKAQKLYRNNVRRYYKSEKTLELDTTNKSIDECVELIVEKLKEVQQGEL
jgi:deoxyadenosine/deoxycytidine kinase